MAFTSAVETQRFEYKLTLKANEGKEEFTYGTRDATKDD
jgi:hypothetical protein